MTADEMRPILSIAGPRFTDLHNSERLVLAHGEDIRHVALWGRWYEWDQETGLWRQDDTGGVVRRMKGVMQAELLRAVSIKDPDKKDDVVKAVLKFLSARSLRDAATLAQSHPSVAVRHDDFDRDRWLFHALDRTIDLRTGVCRPHAQGDLCSKTSRVAWSPEAACPRWLRFLDEVFLERADLIRFVQRAVGACLTGETRDHVVFICYGHGANGKSTFFNALAPVFGDYMTVADAGAFLAKPGDDGRPRNDVARLVGARIVTASEIGEGRRLDEALVKNLSGGEPVTARFLHKEFFEFTPQFKVWLSTNFKPMIRGTDNGIWRRLKLIPFDAHFPPELQDPGLAAALAAEAPGILRWAVEGNAAWREDGLGTCDVVEEATREYRSTQDVIGAFLADRCDVGAAFNDTGSRLYAAYREWSEKNGEHAVRNRDFAAQLQERGFAGKKTKTTKRWEGIALAPDVEESRGSFFGD